MLRALSIATLAMLTVGVIGAEAGRDPRNVRSSGQGVTGLATSAAAADLLPFTVVSNGVVRLGVNAEGHLATGGAGGDELTLSALETEPVGLEFVPTGGDALIPGCFCEGWGLAEVPGGLSGYASVANGGISSNLVVTAFDVTETTAESVVEIGARLRVRHSFAPSTEPSLYRIGVRVENIGATTASSLVYRRVMDWDVPPTEFDEFVTVQGTAPYLLDATNDGFAFVDPLEPLTDLGHRGGFLDAGPLDHGAAFDLSLGDLAPGESTEITLFYGAAATESAALGSLASVGAQVYSLGQPNTPDGPRLGTPNTFAFGIRGACEDDTDCDFLSDTTEGTVGTDPEDADTDGDGLLDSWEVPSSVPGSGFHGPGFESYSPTRAEVFGPFEQGFCLLPGSDLRLSDQVTCFNQPPNPLRKDVFLELDWQDCRIGSCPEIMGLDVDPLHHAPNLPALGRVTDVFADAPVANPSGTSGVALHILVDEAIAHAPNCDQGASDVRPASFGTAGQRASGHAAEILAAKEAAVRYVWSGHSSQSSSGSDCPNPDGASFLFQGLGISELADYDWSPFGDVDVGGSDLLLTLGPVWSCSAEIKLNSGSPFHGPCYRQIKIIQTFGPFGGGYSVVPIPGIFPAKVRDESGVTRELKWPVGQLLGVGETAGITQLWARTLTHLLGHALGLPDEASVRNKPDVPGAPNPVSYASWTGLNYAPGEGTGSLQESFPDSVSLAAQDLDGDGVAEGEDNCAGVPNPEDDGRQPDHDFDEIGDACDSDLDGDGLRGSSSGFTGFLAALAEPVAPADDPFPLDTDNDGLDNDVDPDDDNDGVPDAGDGCPIVPDPLQADADGDGLGDACDLDDDGDSYPDALEGTVGSSPLDPLSAPEVSGIGALCSDGADNDRDGLTDGADGSCRDTDADGMPDDLDNCPSTDNAADRWADGDGDGLGDACDTVVDPATVTVDAVTDPDVGPADLGTGVAWHANRDGPFSVLLGGTGCDNGLQIDAGAYVAPVPLVATIPAALLSAGPNVVRICLTTSAGTFSTQSTVLRTTSVEFEFEGFFPPVDNPPVLNSMKGGAAAPIKFSLGGDFGLDILADGYPASQKISCTTDVPTDPLEETATAGQSGLHYEPGDDQYVYVWKTVKSWRGTCRRLEVKLTDGSVHEALFVFK